MKKIIGLFLVFILILCSCKANQDNISISSTINTNSEKQELLQYQGRESYEEVYSGNFWFAQNETTYFYYDSIGFHSMDKQTQSSKLIADHTINDISRYKDIIYWHEDNICSLALFDINTQTITKKSYKNLFPIEAAENSGYIITPTRINDGWLVCVVNFNVDSMGYCYYKTDLDFTTKTEIPIEGIGLILDDDIFYYNDNGVILCYNLISQKEYLVTKDLNKNLKGVNINNFMDYIGKDKIMITVDDKIYILSLTDGTVFKTIDYPKFDFDNNSPNAYYYNNSIYLQVWESETKYRIEKINYSDASSTVVYYGKSEHVFFDSRICDIDEQYIYINNPGYLIGDTPTSNVTRIKIDGSGEEIIIRETIPEEYLEE